MCFKSAMDYGPSDHPSAPTIQISSLIGGNPFLHVLKKGNGSWAIRSPFYDNIPYSIACQRALYLTYLLTCDGALTV